MDRFFRKTKGAISIFLVIVLLPMMTMASVFVDTSRINLAKSMAESAGDLTLNTALTNYDAALKNLYGLFATSQDMDELMASLEDYYRESIIAAGVDSAAADDYVGQIMNSLKETTGTDDVMNIDLSGFEVYAPTGGHLGNPAILKSQIVEFMKYRAPLSLGTGLLDALGSMKDLSKQTKLVENKNNFYKEHQNLLSTLEDAWWQLQLYQYADAQIGFPTGSYITDQGSYLLEDSKHWKDKEIVKQTVKYLNRYGSFKSLLNDQSKLQYAMILEYKCAEDDCNGVAAANKTTCPICSASLEKSLKYQQWKITWKGTTSVVQPSYTEDSPATADNVLECLKNVYRSIDTVKKYTTGDYSNAYKLVNKSTDQGVLKSVYAVCIFNEEMAKSTHYLKTMKDLLSCLVNLNSAYQTCDKEELANTKVTYVDKNPDKVELASSGGQPISSYITANLKHLSLDQSNDDLSMYWFNSIVSLVNGHYSAAQDTVENAAENVPTAVDFLRDEAYNFDKKLETKMGNLTKANELLTSVKNALTSTSADNKYKTALDAWKGSANNLSDNTMGKNDLAEIEEVTSIVTEDRVNDLIERINKAKATLQGVRDQIAKFKFASTSWKDIKDNLTVIDFYGMLSTWDSQIKAVVPDGDSAYDSIITTILGTVETGSITNTWNDTADSPDLTKQQTDLYTWLYNNFYKEVSDYSEATAPDATSSGDGDMSDMKTSLEKKATGKKPNEEKTASTKVDRDIKPYLDAELKALPSTRWDGEKAEIAEGKIETNADNMLAESNKGGDNMLETILKMASNLGASLRDDLYVAEYIMSMFSYDTIEAELYVKENGSSKDYAAFYNAPAEGSTEYTTKEKFKTYAAKVQTPTNNSINPNMNFLYGDEVEYILYGKGGTAGVYGTIFVLRFALNTVYAFMDAEIGNMTLAAATALFGTPPLTPLIPFAKAAMTIGLAIAESAWDLVELRKGEAVPLMKNKETWVMSPSGIASEVKEEVKTQVEKVADKAIDEGYKVLNEAIEMTSEELEKMINNSVDGLSDLTNSALTTITDQVKNYANEALQEVVELCNAANQKAMLDKSFSGFGATDTKVAEVKAGLQTWLQNQSGDDPVVLEAKTIAVNYLLENGGKQIEEIFNTLDLQSKKDAATTLLENKLTELQTVVETKVNGLLNQAGSKLNEMRTNLEKKLKESAAQGAEKLKETLSNEISGAFGVIPTKENPTQATSTNSVVSSLLSWTYSDYLRIFVVVGLMANEELMLLRIADMIELNMQHKNNEYAVIKTTETVTESRFFGLWETTEEKEVNALNNKAFSLSRSYTYLTVHATLQVKPLLMTLPFMAETTENQLSGTDWYEIEYTGTLGY